MAKLTEEELRKLVQEELDSLSEEELNELLPFAGLGKGIKQAAKGAMKGYRQGRADAVKAKLQKKYGKKVSQLKVDASKLAAAASQEIEKQKKIYKDELKDSKSLDAILNNLAAVVRGLGGIEKAFAARQQAVSEDDSQGSEE
jgi:hypothetical protein